MVNFPTWIPDCDSHCPVLLVLILSSDPSICPTLALPLLENSDYVVMPKLLKGCVNYIFASLFFFCLKESFCETRSVFNFNSKALFIFEIIKF